MDADAKFDEKIMSLIAAAVPGKFRKHQITPQTNLQKELGLDSIGMLALVFRFEELFNIDIAGMGHNIDIAKLKSVGDVIAIARNVLSQVSAGKLS
jgi:acyl carrier protein